MHLLCVFVHVLIYIYNIDDCLPLAKMKKLSNSTLGKCMGTIIMQSLCHFKFLRRQ